MLFVPKWKWTLLGLAVTSLFSGLYFLGCGKQVIQDQNPKAAQLLAKFTARGQPHADPQNCVECHQKETEEWRKSHHAVANDPLTEADRKLLAQSSGGILADRGMDWKMVGDVPVLSEEGLADHPVIGKIGITPLIQYIHLASNGRLQAHEIAWDVENSEWFSVFERDDPPDDPRRPGEWGHWTGQGMNWDANCAYCHMTEYAKGYDPNSDSYNLEWSHMAITCAQCHSGANVHLSQIRNGNPDYSETFTPEQIMESCAACHSRRDELTPHAFRAGDDFEDHFRIALADVEGIYHPDGQVIGENYVYGSLMMSRMGHAGVTCMDCHDPHSHALILPWDNNALCQRCHGSGLQDAPIIEPISHGNHAAGSTGNLCVECHMPVTYFMGRDDRRDHSFSIPDPRLTIELGIPNACNACHSEESPEWAMAHSEEWYGPDMNADRRERAHLMQDLWAGAPDGEPRLLAALENENNRFWKATLISMMRYLPPSQEIYLRLQQAFEDPEPMVRDAAVRVTGVDTLPPEMATKLLQDPVRSVRLSASVGSQNFPTMDESKDRELREYLVHTADSPFGALRLSNYWQSRGDPQAARKTALQAVEFEPLNSEVHRLSAIEIHRSGDPAKSMALLDQAVRLDPDNALAFFNRGLLRHETGQTNPALQDLLTAVEKDPSMESAWYNLVVLYWQLNDLQTAGDQLNRALQALPQSPRLRQLREQLAQTGS